MLPILLRRRPWSRRVGGQAVAAVLDLPPERWVDAGERRVGQLFAAMFNGLVALAVGRCGRHFVEAQEMTTVAALLLMLLFEI